MILDEYLNYLQEDDEEEVEEKAAILRKFSKLLKDPFGKRKLAKLTGPDKEKLEKIIKMKKRAAMGVGLGGVGAAGFLVSKRADIKGQSL